MAKKKHGHHGGAWKVAYADFVTAMMALFLVLWLTSQDQKIKDAIARSFRNPFTSLTKESTGIISNKEMQAVKTTSGNFDSSSVIELNILRKLAEDILKVLQSNPESPDDSAMKLDISPDGLRLSLYDRNRKPLFEKGSSKLTPYGEWVFTTLAWQVARFTNTFTVELEGHTEAGSVPSVEGMDNWDLTTDRANITRRLLARHDVEPWQIRRVAGFADTQPLPDMDVSDERNRRVTVLLKINDAKKQN
ncbi:MAG TPA: flagellar motor protein MotB [Candidatus Limnocylindria bacterium]|jgi:chemotaxis protein MotB|nr:flagellar motor protein MotB [Candidatus Limnocylindria bacterium]